MTTPPKKNADCNRCKRSGLAILPLIYSVAPKEKDVPVVGGNFGGNVISATLTESKYTLRRPDPGYIYLLYPNKHWRGYHIDSAGYPRYYPDLLTEDMPSAIPLESEVPACERLGKTHTGIEAICIEPSGTVKVPVWIAYSRHKWTKSVRDAHAKAPQNRMQAIMLVDGGTFSHAEEASAEAFKKWAVDFNPQAVKAFNEIRSSATPIQDISVRAESLAKAMLGMSGALGKPGLIMALHDPIGIAASLNDYRNQQVEKVLAQDKNTTERDQEDFTVVTVIENLRDNLTKNEGDWPRHEKHLDSAKYDAAKKKLEAHLSEAQRVEAMSADYEKWMNGKATQLVFASDFENKDLACRRALEDGFTVCVQGSGVTKIEREKIWEPWFSDEQSLLWKAATANDKNILDELSAGKIDKTYDAGKGAIGAFKETEWFAHLHQVWGKIKQQRAQLVEYRQATHTLALTLGGQLSWLQKKNNKLYLQTMARFATVLVTRDDLLVVPQNVTSSARNFVRWAQEAFLGKPNVDVPMAAVGGANSSHGRPRIIKPGEIPDEEVRRAAKALDDVLVVDLSGNNGMLGFTTWVASKLEPGKPMPDTLDDLFKRLKLDRQQFVLPEKFKFNPLSEHARGLKTARFVDKPLSAISGIFAMTSFISASNALTDELKKGKSADEEKQLAAMAGMATAVTSAIAATLEFKAANLMIAQKGATTFGVRVLGGVAAGLGAAVTATDAYFAWRNASKLSSEGDDDAAMSAFKGAKAGTAGAISGAVVAWMIFVGTGGIALAIAIGATVITVGASVIFGIQADDKTDTELEKWLNRCRFGTHSRPDCKAPFSNLEEEMTVLRQAIYAVQIVTRTWAESATLRNYLTLGVPFYATDSELEIQWWGTSPDGQPRQIEQAIFSKGALKAASVRQPQAVVGGELTPTQKGKALAVEGELLVRRPPLNLQRNPQGTGWVIQVGSVLRDVSTVPYFTEIVVKVRYKPDTKTWPELVVEAQT
ncbi:toxin VasX [Azonexus caeni]|jgi:hypothetical protein|uniref:toxin VasX n=1 Tax=Azonexus caeni TaxID=266126 RepID=UPI003A853567